MKTSLIAFIIGASAIAAADKIPAEQLTTPCVFTNSVGQTLLYRWAAPANVQAGKKYPLVVLFHGAGERGNNNKAQLVHGATDILNYMKDKNVEGYFIAAQCPNGQQWVNTPWSFNAHDIPAAPSEAMSKALELIDKTVATLPIDTDRIYVTGISMGGYGTWDAISRRPHFFAAAMPICGGADVAQATRLTHMPIWCFHGDKDTVVPFQRSREMVSRLWCAGGNIRYREYPNCGHGSWFATYADWTTLDWLFAQRRNKSVRSIEFAQPLSLTNDKWIIMRDGCKNDAEYLERVREAGAAVRECWPEAKIGGESVDAAGALAFAATGESEEVDFWKFTQPISAEELTKVRTAFDGAGGRAVKLCNGVANKFQGSAPNALLMAGTGRAYIVNSNGEKIWEKIGCGNIHRVQQFGNYIYYSNGSLYRVPRIAGGATRTAAPELVYRPAQRVGGGVLGFEVLPNGNIVMAINSTDEIIEIDNSRKVVVNIKVDVRGKDGTTPGAHGHLRMVSKTATGTYLVCCAGARMVREYDATGKLIWEQEVPILAFDAKRLPNGNTLISHIDGVSEFTPQHKVVWSFKCSDAPALKLACLCGLSVKPNGNIVIGTWANGANGNATAVEVTREKKIVWSFAADDVNMMSATTL